MITDRCIKITIVSPSLKLGGIERALSVLANYFATQGHKVSFVSCLAAKRFYTLHSSIQILEPKFKRTKSAINKILFYPRLLWFIRKKVKETKPDLVLSFGDNFNPLVLLSLMGTQLPVFISDRTSPDFPFGKIVQMGKKWLYPRSAGFIAQTQRAYNYKKKQFGERLQMRVIPNAIKQVKGFPETERQPVILCVARLFKEKGPDRLLKAFAAVPNRNGWRLLFAGSGPMKQGLQKDAEELGVANEVDFLGEINAVDELLAGASIFVLPSRLEGFPNALCEAMVAGLPVVCFDAIPHEALVIHQHNGLVVPDGDISSLADTLQWLIDHPNERMRIGESAKQIKERLNVETIGQQYLDFLISRISS
jgi:glycosyltransferase involved in cell wall biosynthesis